MRLAQNSRSAVSVTSGDAAGHEQTYEHTQFTKHAKTENIVTNVEILRPASKHTAVIT